MTDHSVTLRPAREDDLDVVERLTQDPQETGEFTFFGWRDTLHWRSRWAEDRLLALDHGLLMVARGDEALGFVAWARKPTTPAGHCVSMGIGLLSAARGHGYGAEAHRLLARYLFAHTTVHRIEADTEVENIAEQRALEKAGFSREGVMRGCAWRNGAWRDGVTYSLLRTDPPV